MKSVHYIILLICFIIFTYSAILQMQTNICEYSKSLNLVNIYPQKLFTKFNDYQLCKSNKFNNIVAIELLEILFTPIIAPLFGPTILSNKSVNFGEENTITLNTIFNQIIPDDECIKYFPLKFEDICEINGKIIFNGLFKYNSSGLEIISGKLYKDEILLYNGLFHNFQPIYCSR